MNRRFFIKMTLGFTAATVFQGCGGTQLCGQNKVKPNVILFITDDQGYGDLACHGNQHINTPNMDSLYHRSVRLDDFHVGPTCAPTRASLMTGKYCNSVGVWHTIAGRSILKEGYPTLAEILSDNGYVTGLFGKWHLGDNYPARAQDKGFDEVLCHGGGGVGQTPDYWGNDYFNDTYFRNGKPEKHSGYCTDVWFDAAMDFIEENRDNPFFAYISTNAPHDPYHVNPKYVAPYKDNPDIPIPEFYGMISNLDENLGRLTEYLRENNLEKNTLFIFMTDNGSSGGVRKGKGFNAGMRGLKGSEYDGGHRVPCFISYPNGGIGGGRDFDELTAHIDIMPTILDICGIKINKDDFDGISLLPYIQDGQSSPKRVIVTDSQRIDMPIKWRKSSVMTNRWRLVNGKELYDIKIDPGQRNDVSADNPETVRLLQIEYEKWWQKVSGDFDNYAEIVIGSSAQSTTLLTAHDWHPEPCTWHQQYIRDGRADNGKWSVSFEKTGIYEFELRRWPRESDTAICDVAEKLQIEYDAGSWYDSKSLNITDAILRVGSRSFKKKVEQNMKSVTFNVNVDSGSSYVETEFTNDILSLGAYYVYVTRLTSK